MNRHRGTERGQALIIMVFAVVGLLVAAGLAIDGGSVILERRRMQNAADAAAMAGARQLGIELCSTNSRATADGLIRAQMLQYADSNGVEDLSAVEGQYVRFAGSGVQPFNPPALVGGGTIPNGATGVRVTTAITRSTHMLGLLGQDTAGAGARAIAVAGPSLLLGGGIRPFGLPWDVVQYANPGDCFRLIFKNCKDEDEESCPIQDENGELVGHHRNWLNLGYVWNQTEASDWPRAIDKAGDAAVLKEWMANGWDGIVYPDCFGWDTGCRRGDYAHAKPGTTSAPIGYAPEEEPFLLPVFDKVPSYGAIPSPKPPDATQGGGYYYHIIDLVPVQIPVGGQNRGQGWVEICLLEWDYIVGTGQPNPTYGGYGAALCRSPRAISVTLYR